MSEHRLNVRRRRLGDWKGITGLGIWLVTCTHQDCPGEVWMSSFQGAVTYASESARRHFVPPVRMEVS